MRMLVTLLLVTVGIISFSVIAPPVAGSTTSVLVLCDGKVLDGYTIRPVVLKEGVALDPTVQKVIRNCTFKNAALPAIAIWSAKNVLIEGNTFENIRSHQAGIGVHAINIPCRVPCAIDNVVIRNNTFRSIGADGIQLGEESRTIANVWIEGNQFEGSEDVGENAIDIKGVNGPIYVRDNLMHGFRPCQSPKSNPPGTQDCTGSNGTAMVIHTGTSGAPNNVTVENNDFYDSTRGLEVSTGSSNIIIRGNRIYNNLSLGLLVNQAFS